MAGYPAFNSNKTSQVKKKPPRHPLDNQEVISKAKSRKTYNESSSRHSTHESHKKLKTVSKAEGATHRKTLRAHIPPSDKPNTIDKDKNNGA
jgi:hypothetical protein